MPRTSSRVPGYCAPRKRFLARSSAAERIHQGSRLLERGPAGLAAFFTGHIMADLAWYSLVAAAVAGSGYFLTPRIYRGILAVCGSFLVMLGGYFIWSGLVKNRWLG